MKTLLAAGAAVLALAGCASGPYYDTYGYGPGYSPYYYDYGYGAPAYYGPSVGLGYYYYDSDGHRRWHEGRDQRDHGDRGHWGDRPDYNDRGDRMPRPADQLPNAGNWHGERGNEAGM